MIFEEGDAEESNPVVHLNYCGIRDLNEIPAVRNCPERIQYLYLKRNRLKYLSFATHGLYNLIQLHLEGNEIEILPDEIGKLKHLQVLNVVSNYLTHLPCCIGELGTLRTLQVCNNNIVNLPNEIGNLQFLETLEATRNQLKCIPVEVSYCRKLRLLALDKNLLQELPRQLCWLPNLADLSLSGNCLEYLPPVMFKMLRSLRSIMLDNNIGLNALPKLCYPTQTVHINSPALLSPSVGVTASLNVNDECYYMPKEIHHQCTPSNSCVPLLEELALRSVHARLKHDCGAESLPLPHSFIDSLRYPTTYCLHCDSCMFKSGFPVIYVNPNCLLPTLEFCCSVRCLLAHNFHGCRLKYPPRTSY